MPWENLVNGVGLVALRKESVDRNLAYAMPSQEVFWSLSVRRAWIEIDEQIEQEPTPEGRSP